MLTGHNYNLYIYNVYTYLSPPFLPHSAEITATSSKTDVKLCQNSNLKMRKKKSPEELIFKLTNEKNVVKKTH